MYGDFMIDIAAAEAMVPGRNVAELIRRFYEERGMPIQHYNERLTGARYFRGLDGLRFYAKMGWNADYLELRDQLLGLPSRV
ncbi:hypothetical protein D3C81_1739370 [compost metagenome]